MTQSPFRAAPDVRPPLVSVVMANYGGASFLPAALASVLGQTVNDLEVIVSDDASPDSSCQVVRRFARNDARVRLITSTENRGPAAARNRALAAARGEWIAIVDSDDMIHPERFEILLAAASASRADAVADDLLFFSETNGVSTTLLARSAQNAPRQIPADEFVRSNTAGSGLRALGYLKPIFRRSKLAGLHYDEDVRIAEDYDFLLRFLLDGGRMLVLPEPLYLYRRHTASISHRLSEGKVLGMIAGHDRLVAGRTALPTKLRDLLDKRRRTLVRSLEFERLVSSLKQRRLRDAAAHLAAEPRLSVPLARSVIERMSVRRKTVWPRRVAGGPLVLHGPDVTASKAAVLCAELGLGADLESVSVPPYLPPAARAAAPAFPTGLAAKLRGGHPEVAGIGLAGLYALAFVPVPCRATAVLEESGEVERALGYLDGTSIRLVIPDAALRGAAASIATEPFANGYRLVVRSATPQELRSAANAV